MSSLVIIPARGGSKRIPRKNIKLFRGKPIIAYSITLAIESGLFDEIMVSTDDREIADIALKMGANVPFLRSPGSSNDFATLSEVILEIIEQYNTISRYFDTICLVLPTSPLTTKEVLARAYQKFVDGNFSAVVPVARYCYPIQRAFVMDEESRLKMLNPANKNVRSQDLQPTFHDAGQFYWIKTSDFLQSKAIFMEDVGSLELDSLYVQDIDDESDWKIAELKHEIIERLGTSKG